MQNRKIELILHFFLKIELILIRFFFNLKLLSNLIIITNMPIHQCPTCLKEFKQSCNFKRHLARKFPCKPAVQVEAAKSCVKPQEAARSCEKPQSNWNNTEITPTTQEGTTCCYCNKYFKRQKNLFKHYRNTCEKIPEAKRLFYLNKYKNDKRHINNNKQLAVINNNNNCHNNIKNIKNINNNCNNNSNNTNNIQNNITIKLNAFGKEDISSLEKKDILKLIDKAYKMIPDTMKAIHFNIPENRNMFIPNVNRPLVKVYNGEEWVFKSLENVTRIVSDNIRDNIESWTNRYDKKLSPTKKKALNAFVAECIEGKMQMLFKDELKMFLMTYSQKLKDFVNEEITNKLEDLQIEIDPEEHE